MKIKYKGLDLDLTREKCFGRWNHIHCSASESGREIICGHINSKRPLRELMRDFKRTVDEMTEDKDGREEIKSSEIK
jgi:hypothetical protein